MEYKIDIFTARSEMQCDLTGRWIKEGKPYKFVWVHPLGNSFIVKTSVSNRRIRRHIKRRLYI